ncbi:peroxiredoxin [Halobacteriales archaeon SW_7_68_16]|nr:MAG: peroxiredoxin [Halobacteriales archaeon SW_7_68_16]
MPDTDTGADGPTAERGTDGIETGDSDEPARSHANDGPVGESVPLDDLLLPNVGVGPDPFDFVRAAGDHDWLVVLLQRDNHCTNCRKQVRRVRDAYDEFRERDAEVVSIVPEPEGKVAEWVEEYDPPFPLLADPDTVAGERFDQPVRFGVLGSLSDFLGRMPLALVVDCRGDGPRLAYAHAGTSTWDRPTVEELLDVIDAGGADANGTAHAGADETGADGD